MTGFKPLHQSTLNDIRYSNKSHGILFHKFAKTSEVNNFSDLELTEMYNGFYIDKKILLTDGDYSINLRNVVSAFCILKNVTYIKKPTQKDYETGSHNLISNIKTFYVKNYFLVTEKPEGWDTTEHDITKQLSKAGAFKKGSGNFRQLYRIPNNYKALQKFERGSFSKDLFYPIKQFINLAFFKDEYKISDFFIKSEIDIKVS